MMRENEPPQEEGLMKKTYLTPESRVKDLEEEVMAPDDWDVAAEDFTQGPEPVVIIDALPGEQPLVYRRRF